MKKRIIGIFVCMLLIATVLPVSGIVMVEKISNLGSDGNTLYVGGIGPGNYSKIQDAINDSSNGDTVFVYDDSSPYYECIEIDDKSIHLIGEGNETTVINGSLQEDDVIHVLNTNMVVVSDFTIQNGYYYGILLNWVNNCIISRNHIKNNNWSGIRLSEASSYNTISSNTVTNNGLSPHYYEGIDLGEESNHNVVSQNTVENNEIGIALFESHYNDIFNNVVIFNKYEGIGLDFANGNNITNNVLVKNSVGIYLVVSNDNVIHRNHIGERFGAGNNESGILIRTSEENTLSENNIVRNLGYGIKLILDSRFNAIKRNNFIGNKFHAYFENSFNNKWRNNYWDDWFGIIPRPIWGTWIRPLRPWPWLNLDWFPAVKEYDY